MSSEIEAEPKRRKRSRISYADRCQEHERDKAAMQAKLATILTILHAVEPAPGCDKLLQTAKDLIREMAE